MAPEPGRSEMPLGADDDPDGDLPPLSIGMVAAFLACLALLLVAGVGLAAAVLPAAGGCGGG
jgi:hypothetical protein